jgi:hypothetical protein
MTHRESEHVATISARNGTRPSHSWLITIGLLVVQSFFLSLPLHAQEPSEQTTITGTVISADRSSLLVKTADGRYRLFSFDRNTTKPTTIPIGSEVRVTSYPSGDPTYRTAYTVTLASQAPPAQAAGPEQPDVIPPEVRRAEEAIKRGARRYKFGMFGGVAIDPELLAVGVHAQVGPFFNRNLAFRPNVEFDWGEVTWLFGINAEMIYHVPREGKWDFYFGGGPAFNFVQRDLSRPTGADVGFSDFHYDSALNILVGAQFRSGMFTEVKTSLYASPAPIFRILVGYNF